VQYAATQSGSRCTTDNGLGAITTNATATKAKTATITQTPPSTTSTTRPKHHHRPHHHRPREQGTTTGTYCAGMIMIMGGPNRCCMTGMITIIITTVPRPSYYFRSGARPGTNNALLLFTSGNTAWQEPFYIDSMDSHAVSWFSL
jgi:hypothetical protein